MPWERKCSNIKLKINNEILNITTIMPPKKTTPATKTATRVAQKPASTGRTGPSKAVSGSGGTKKGVVKPAVNKSVTAGKKNAVSPTKEKGKGKNEAEGKAKVG